MKQRIFNTAKQSFRWMRAHMWRAGFLALFLALLSPSPVKSQFLDPCCAILAAGLSTISSTLSGVIGGGLNQILSVDKRIENFEQSVVWPANLINQARGLVGQLSGTFSQMQSIMAIPVNSAMLPATRQFEQNLLSANAGQIGNTPAVYQAVYGAAPTSQQSSPQVQDMVDMGDAAAQAAMKRSIEIDHLADLEIQAANQLNQAIASAAPGSAPIIEAQADAWLVRANAYTQGALADEMRLHAVRLANQGEDMKLGAAASSSMIQKLEKLLQ